MPATRCPHAHPARAQGRAGHGCPIDLNLPGSPGPGERSVPDRSGRAPIHPLQSEPRALPPPRLARAGFDLLLGESPSTITHDQRGHLLTMVSLCDDLLRLTRSYLDYAGIVQGSRPLCLGSFTIGALIDEIDRQFAPIAAARRTQLGIARRSYPRSWSSPTPRAASRFSATWSRTP